MHSSNSKSEIGDSDAPERYFRVSLCQMLSQNGGKYNFAFSEVERMNTLPRLLSLKSYILNKLEDFISSINWFHFTRYPWNRRGIIWDWYFIWLIWLWWVFDCCIRELLLASNCNIDIVAISFFKLFVTFYLVQAEKICTKKRRHSSTGEWSELQKKGGRRLLYQFKIMELDTCLRLLCR